MKAKDYANLSAQCGNMATMCKPDEKSPVAHTANLAVYYLRAASRELQRLAEWQAEQEKA